MCTRGCAKKLLLAFNVVFYLLGILAIAIGVFIIVQNPEILKTLMRIPIKDSQSSEDALEKPSLLEMGAYVLIGGGGVIFLIGFFGFCGALTENRLCIAIYGCMVGLILMIEVAAGVMCVLYWSEVDSRFHEFLHDTIHNDYANGTSTDDNGKIVLPDDPVSLAWDTAHLGMECCGVDNHTDFQTATNWHNTYTVLSGGHTITITALVPITCCRANDPDVFPEDLDKLTFVDARGCLETPEPENTYTKGCYGSLKDLVAKYSKMIMAVGLFIGIIQILGITSAIVLYRGISKKKKQQNRA